MGTIVPVPNVPEIPLENEQLLGYKKNSKERVELEKVLADMSNTCEDVPIVIGNEEIRTEAIKYQVMVS